MMNAQPQEYPIQIDGRSITTHAQATVLEACKANGIPIPTFCYAENLTPVNVCRMCVVEIEGSRVLAPACSRKVEPNMVIHTQSPRVNNARKLVLELLGSSADLSLSKEFAEYCVTYGANPHRFGNPNSDANLHRRDESHAGHHGHLDGNVQSSIHEPVKIDNNLYVRDYAKCILCYKCVEACGADAQNTFAIAVAGRGFDARISTESNVPLPDSACVYCGNCIGVCPTSALMFKSEYDLRQKGEWKEEQQSKTTTVCPYCGVGCAVTLHVQNNEIVKVTSPVESTVTNGHLCIKGRFGFEFVHLPKKKDRERAVDG